MLPDGDDFHSRRFFQAAIANASADERCIVHREVRDEEIANIPDDMTLGMTGIDAAREAGSELLMQGEHIIAAAQLEDIDGVLVFNRTDDRNFRRDLAHGQGDVGIDGVAAIGQYQTRLRDSEVLISGAAIDFAGDDGNSVSMHAGSCRVVRFDDAIRNSVETEPIDQS